MGRNREKTSYKLRKMVAFFAAFALLLTFAVACAIPTASAEGYNSVSRQDSEGRSTLTAENYAIDSLKENPSDSSENSWGPQFVNYYNGLVTGSADADAYKSVYDSTTNTILSGADTVLSKDTMAQAAAYYVYSTKVKDEGTIKQILTSIQAQDRTYVQTLLEIKDIEEDTTVSDDVKELEIEKKALRLAGSSNTFYVDAGFSVNELVDDDVYSAVASEQAGNAFTTITGILNAGFIDEVLTDGTDSKGSVSTSIVNLVLNIVKGFGIALALVYAFIHFFQILARGELKLEAVLKVAIPFFIALILILKCNALLTVVDNLGMTVVDNIAYTIQEEQLQMQIDSIESSSDSDTEGVVYKSPEESTGKSGDYGYYHKDGWADGGTYFWYVNLEGEIIESKVGSVSLGAGTVLDFTSSGELSFGETSTAAKSSAIKSSNSWLTSFFLKILNTLTLYAIAAASFGLIFSFGMRRAFFPLALADVSGEGLRSPGFNFIKAYFALYLEMAYFYIVALISVLMEAYAQANAYAASQTNTVLGTFGAIICIRTATAAALRKSSEISKTVLGIR